jgi:hypothetical protein
MCINIEGVQEMDEGSRQLLLGAFAYLVAIGGIIATLGAAFAGN